MDSRICQTSTASGGTGVSQQSKSEDPSLEDSASTSAGLNKTGVPVFRTDVSFQALDITRAPRKSALFHVRLYLRSGCVYERPVRGKLIIST